MIFHEFSAADLLNPNTGIGAEALYKLMDDLMEDVEKDTVRAWINEYDKDSNGLIDITEFVQVMLDKIIQVTDTEVCKFCDNPTSCSPSQAFRVISITVNILFSGRSTSSF